MAVRDTLTLQVGAEGTGLHYQWFQDGQAVGVDSPTFTLDEVLQNEGQFSYNSVFRVRVTDDLDRFVDSADALIEVTARMRTSMATVSWGQGDFCLVLAAWDTDDKAADLTGDHMVGLNDLSLLISLLQEPADETNC